MPATLWYDLKYTWFVTNDAILKNHYAFTCSKGNLFMPYRIDDWSELMTYLIGLANNY
jgi:hypothetical protein